MTCSPRVPADFIDDAGHLSYLGVHEESWEPCLRGSSFSADYTASKRKTQITRIFQTFSTSTNWFVKVAKNETTWNNDVWISVTPFVFSGCWMKTIPWPSHQQLHLSGTFRSVVHQLPQVDFHPWDLDGYTHPHPNQRNSLPFLKGNESSSKPSDFPQMFILASFQGAGFTSGALTIWKYSWQHANNEAPIEYRPQCDDCKQTHWLPKNAQISSENAPK